MKYLLLLISISISLLSVAQPAYLNQKNSTTKKSRVISLSTTNKVIAPAKRNCYSTDYEKSLQEKYPSRLSSKAFEELLSKRINGSLANMRKAEEIYRIPTIVHVVHNGENPGAGANITAAQVNSQFEVLNEDFRRMGAGFNDHPSGADILVEFFPVVLDPSGNTLDEAGINRINGGQSAWGSEDIETNLKPSTFWDPGKYFNIWVVNFGGDLNGVLGYAQFPSLSSLDGLFEDEGPAETDGIIIGYPFFGTTGNVQAPFDLGRTTTHEVGHWLGLRHIWGDGGCDVDDYCADTPNAGAPNYECAFVDSCPGGDADMIENYMDYTDDACMNIFTQEQKARMRTVLEVSPRRNSLISPACQDAEMALSGSNTTTPSLWYTYTAESQEIATVSSVGQTSENTYLQLYPDCESNPINFSDDALGTEQSELSVLLDAGESLKIYWRALHSEAEFDWTLSSSEPGPAAACELASMANTGTNSLPETDLNTYWYQYTVNQDLSKVTINSEASYRLYTNTCDQLRQAASGTGAQTAFDLMSGSNVFIEFEAQGGGFDWTLEEAELEVGESCLVSVEATQGSNTAPQAPFWYSFTMSEFGDLVVSSSGLTNVETYARIYQSCGGQLLSDNIGDENGQTEIRVSLDAGEEVLIEWADVFSADGFDWEARVELPEPGELCEVAIEAVEGVNTASKAPEWFSFTMPMDGNLTVSSLGFTESDTYLVIFDECEGEVIAENDDVGDALQSTASVYTLLSGQEVKIVWAPLYSVEGFDWELTVTESVPGDACENSTTAVLGTNEVTMVPGDFWSRFTIPEDNKKLVITSNSNEDVYFLSPDCNDLYILSSGTGNASAIGLSSGDEVIIVWNLQEGGGFEYELSIEEISAGDVCSDPITAVEGINSSDAVPTWFSFTAPFDGNITVSSIGFTDSDTYLSLYDDCQGTPIAESDDVGDLLQSSATVRGISAGETVYILWADFYSNSAFDWELTFTESIPGDACENSVTAVLGTNEVAVVSEDFWARFTMPEDNKKLVITSDSNEDVYFLTPDCNDLFIIGSGTGNASTTALGAGDEVIIVWNLQEGGGFDYELSLEEISVGDECSNPLSAAEGINSNEVVPSWFSFTAPFDGSITVSSIGFTDSDTYVFLYDDCQGNPIAESDDVGDLLQSSATATGISSGETIYIQWANIYSNTVFDWELTFEVPTAGESCELPIEANLGINSSPSMDLWYTYSIPEDGDLKVSSLGLTEEDTYLFVYNDCGEIAIAESDDEGSLQSEVVLSDLQQGDTLLIFWAAYFSNAAFDWELSLVNTSNTPPAFDNHSFEVPSNVKNGDVLGTLIATDVDVDQSLIYEVVSGAEHDAIGLNATTGEVSMVDVELMDSDVTFQVKVSDGFSTTTADVELKIINSTPLIEAQSVIIERNVSNDDIIGTVLASDDDNDDLKFYIVSQNDPMIFELGETNGEIKVIDISLLESDMEITVEVRDQFAKSEAVISLSMANILTASQKQFNIYPNPANDLVRIQSTRKVDRITLSNLAGKEILSLQNASQIDVSDLAEGIYLLKVTVDNRIEQRKLLIQR